MWAYILENQSRKNSLVFFFLFSAIFVAPHILRCNQRNGIFTFCCLVLPFRHQPCLPKTRSRCYISFESGIVEMQNQTCLVFKSHLYIGPIVHQPISLAFTKCESRVSMIIEKCNGVCLCLSIVEPIEVFNFR